MPLTIAAYLALAGESIEIEAETASLVAGWNPDETYWFTDNVRHYDEPVAWECADANSGGTHLVARRGRRRIAEGHTRPHAKKQRPAGIG